MKQNLKGIIFCNAGYSSSLMSAKLNELGEPYGIVFDEGGFGVFSMDELASKYDVALLAPHLRGMYDDISFSFEEKNVPFLQIEQNEYTASGQGVYVLFDRVKEALNIS